LNNSLTVANQSTVTGTGLYVRVRHAAINGKGGGYYGRVPRIRRGANRRRSPWPRENLAAEPFHGQGESTPEESCGKPCLRIGGPCS
jgi:hypothetical protein